MPDALRFGRGLRGLQGYAADRRGEREDPAGGRKNFFHDVPRNEMIANARRRLAVHPIPAGKAMALSLRLASLDIPCEAGEVDAARQRGRRGGLLDRPSCHLAILELDEWAGR